MRLLMLFAVLAVHIDGAQADDETMSAPVTAKSASAGAPQPTPAPMQPSPVIVPLPALSPRPARAPAIPPIVTARQSAAAAQKTEDSSALFSAEAKWDLAGYNNDEVIYTISITSRDPRILRCTTELQGAYYENGEKHTVSDRQITTVFPGQPTTAGNWQGMDKQTGATYSVKCHPV